MLAGSAVQSIS